MSNKPTARDFYVGLAGGQIWLTLVSAYFSSFIWIFGRTPTQITLLIVGAAFISILLLVADIMLLRMALRLPKVQSSANITAGKMIRRRFGFIVLCEIIVIGAINIVLANTGHGIWITPWTFFIVGLHFLPLAFVFHVRAYFVTGLLWVAVVIATVLATSASMIVGQGLSAWIAYPLVGCGFATWVTIAYILTENFGHLRRVVLSQSTT